MRQNRLAAAICFTCQGLTFLLSGEEFARTKQGIKNTYRSPLTISRIDWRRAWENRALVDYYRGLISLRKMLPGLRDKSAHAGERILAVTTQAENCVTVLLDNRGENCPWAQLLLAYNAGAGEAFLTLPRGTWEILADGDSGFLWQAPQKAAEGVQIPPVSALILGKRRDSL